MSIALQIDKMSTNDRLQAMEDLWDALTHEKKEMESPEWHKDILFERRKDFEEGKTKYITLDQLKNKYRR